MSNVTQIVLAVHIIAGFAALVAGTVAICARKGGRLHRAGGKIFAVTMLTMAVTAAILGAILPGQSINVFIGILAIYLVSTGWITVTWAPEKAAIANRIALGVSLCLCAPFALLIVPTLTGGPPLIHSSIPLKGPVLIALYAFSFMLAMASAGDARVVYTGGLTGTARLCRHLWRMCLGLTFAAGSGFTNGIARLLPGPYHVPPVFFLPQFIPLLVMVFWLIWLRLPRFQARVA
jgi:uncharacterized membrane protein